MVIVVIHISLSGIFLQIKQVTIDRQAEFYGIPAWPIIMNINLPLMLFFYFHSSICLADVWDEAYHIEEGPKYQIL